jgi:hypothetical protein
MLLLTPPLAHPRRDPLPQFTWSGDEPDAGLLQTGRLWAYLERLSTEHTVPGFLETVPFEPEAAPARDGGADDVDE